MVEIVLISGHLQTGKTFLAKRLSDEHGFTLVRTSDLVKSKFHEHGKPDLDRSELQKFGDQWDTETDWKWLYDEVAKFIKNEEDRIVIDHVRNARQLKHFRDNPAWKTKHIHLYDLAVGVLKTQYESRKGDDDLPYDLADPVESEDEITEFKRDADIRINVGNTDDEDTYIRAAARLRLFSNPKEQCVDVLIGGQFGSEGKGHIAASISGNYDLLVRVGGPNAGHTVSSKSGTHIYHQLPSGCKDSAARLLLGPGMTINKEKLLEEIKKCRVGIDRLGIDPQAIIITSDDILSEETMRTQIASTASGSGAASARRIMERTGTPPLLARDDEDLKKYTKKRDGFAGDAIKQLEKFYSENKKILLEGTQGSGLSIFNGQYPHVTSRDTNVSGCLAEVGISPKRVRRIIMVVRTTPIRVGNPDESEGENSDTQSFTSGNLKNEVTFKEIAAKAGLDPDEVEKSEITSTTRRNRRVGWFDWELFRRSCMINTPTDIALTFTDYISVKNQDARRFEQLTEHTIKFIEELEQVSQARVSIINTRFQKVEQSRDLRSLIDRLDWL